MTRTMIIARLQILMEADRLADDGRAVAGRLPAEQRRFIRTRNALRTLGAVA